MSSEHDVSTALSSTAADGRLSLAVSAPSVEQLAALKDIFPESFVEGRFDVRRLEQALQSVEVGPERYGLGWSRKGDAIRTLQQPTTATLKPTADLSVQFDATRNAFVEGDSLEVLKLLQRGYRKRVKMIYIDPPYNTGKEFIYPDNFREGLQEYLRFTGQKAESGTRLTTNAETSGRFHSKWLSMMYPRLFLARQLLQDDGVIFVSIDDNEIHNLRVLLNDVFGEENFIAQLIVQLNPRGRHLDQFVAKTHEYVVTYARDAAQQTAMNELDKEGKQLKEYDKEDERGKYRELELRNRNPAFNRKTRPTLFYPLYVDPIDLSVALQADEKHSEKVLPLNATDDESCWTWSPAKVAKQGALLVGHKTGEGKWRVFRKDHLIKEDGTAAGTLPKSVWLDSDINNDQGRKAIQDLFGANVMDFPKAPGLIRRLVRIGTEPDDLVLDFFAGSGTTGQAVIEQNQLDGGTRRFILVQLPEPTPPDSVAQTKGILTIAQLCRERLQKFAERTAADPTPALPMTATPPSDYGFKAFRLTESNFKLWDSELATASGEKELQQQLFGIAENVSADATDDDVLFELMLKTGVDINAARIKTEVAGQAVYFVGGELIICLHKHITQEIIRGMIALSPRNVLCLDIGFAGNDQLKTNAVLEMESHGIQFHTV